MHAHPYRDKRRWLNLNSGLKEGTIELRLGVAVIVTHAVVGVPGDRETCLRGHFNFLSVLNFGPHHLVETITNLLASSVETSSEAGGGNDVGADGAVGEVEFPWRILISFY